MKIQHFTLLSLLLGCCAVSAQTPHAFTNTNPASGAIDLIQSGTDTTWTDASKTNINFLLQVKKREGMTLNGVTLIEKWPVMNTRIMYTRIITADIATLSGVGYGSTEIPPSDGTRFHTNLVDVCFQDGKVSVSDSGGGSNGYSFSSNDCFMLKK